MNHSRRRFNKRINVYMRHLKKWNAYYQPERKNTLAELRLWVALHRAIVRVISWRSPEK